MNQTRSRFVTLEEAKNVAGALKESELVYHKSGQSQSLTPTIAITDFIVDGELYFKLLASYYYVSEKLQILVVETKDHNNDTVEFSEKIWEYNLDKKKYHHEKYLNGELTVSEYRDEGYDMPDKIAEFQDAKRFEESVEAQDTAAAACFLENPPFGVEPCCLFEGVEYNYCGSYCGVNRDAGGGAVVNTCDVCCFNHDNCLERGDDRCGCHADILDCLGRYSCPGDSTMGAGMRVKATNDGCYF
ncbi:hypothetical protein AAV35_14090 [Salimicrobium jeotgali]|uniref:Uncharacterized protein n=1 Tax=Salimicrobium jeotgali TaxID=1230341 RepID=K2FIF9_9BACI|nr:hypothetical protein [Salimicrobium jeotgali]APC65556.1 hypothetical protein AAV35_14090 [Salimicrobium jeotgali]EKE30881.1 hypothetical protein MJ3_11290 [Salimicrobium jeotgali]MBM7697654.1 hypothetical protein [Salimicrobium jeotgali]